MERKFLKDLGIADDVIDKIMAENGKDINELKSAVETSKTTLADLQKQISERDKQLETLKKSSGDNEALKQQITELQEANKKAKDEYDANLKKLTLGSKIEVALMGAMAKNVKAVRALLDESKISLDGENVLGLKEQLEQVQKENPYLFGEETKNPPPPAGGEPAKPQDDLAKWAAEAGVTLPKT
ncbi:scaffolding protein [Caproiciproducens galactitolivorans]|uniref:Phage minor structural protein GP20 n=1 Tax=Caproiciproducens galactitolivorans TaxID=642589 RepID=A0A4Z0Y882_9FIRM|nr:phage scaffolding protein [Caproiciproducens galactitolivorans]QEY33726.1 scaffolding protein [Caproiciproducens galactitolivorans]TGJ75491.1 phage minor structural protein GP20 [Caproiciproducens galactitolivorans]